MRWINNFFKRERQTEEKQEPVELPSPTPAVQDQVARQPARPADEAVERRARRAAESLMENEALTADLDDSAARVLLKWGADLTKDVAALTAGLDDAQAEESMSERMRATRQLLRSVNKWIAGQSSLAADEKSTLFTYINEQLALIYGPGYAAPDAAHLEAFIQDALQPSSDPAQAIAQLRQLYQSPTESV